MTDQKIFEFFDRAADIDLTVHGGSLPELFENAGHGLMALVVDPETVSAGGFRERIRAEGADREALLVNWLNQILFLFNVQQIVFCKFHIRMFSETAIEAEGEGELFDPGRHGLQRAVKAASYRGLKIEQTGGHWTAQVTLEANP
jgi:SHS2 domain-containing protein